MFGFADLCAADSNATSTVPTHFAGKAKHVIHVFLNGGMSQVDTFDPKPELTKRGGKMLLLGNLQTERKTGVALPSPFKFEQHGESGIPISDIFPCLSKCADDLVVVRSMFAIAVSSSSWSGFRANARRYISRTLWTLADVSFETALTIESARS